MRRLRIPVMLGSTRRGRRSEHPARYLLERLALRKDVESELFDPVGLPMLEERLHKRGDPPTDVAALARLVAGADALLIVSPEYSGGYPGVLKNALDYLKSEFRRLPVGIATVSSSSYGGMSCLAQLRHVLLCLGAVPIPERLAFFEVDKVFDDESALLDPRWEQRTEQFLDELVWFAGTLGARARSTHE